MRTFALLVALLALTASAQDPRFKRFTTRTDQGRNSRGLLANQYAFFEFAPLSGLGITGGACSTTASLASTSGVAAIYARSGTSECYSQDGQTLTNIPANIPVIMSGDITSSWLGVVLAGERANFLLQSRDLSNAAWTKTNMTCVRNQTGMRNDSNGATRCTATAPNATVCQAIVRASEIGTSSWHIKRAVGTGTVEVSRDNLTSAYAITSRLSSTTWKRVVPFETYGCAGGNCITVPEMTSTLANPTNCIRLGTSGDAVDVDFVQTENGEGATLPIATTTGAASRFADTLRFDLGSNSGPSINQLSVGFTSVGPVGWTPTVSNAIPVYLSAVSATDNSGANAVWMWSDGVAGELRCFAGNAAGTLHATTQVGNGSPIGRHYCVTEPGAKTQGKSGFNSMLQSVSALSGTFGQVRYINLGAGPSGSYPSSMVLKGFVLDPSPTRAIGSDPALPGSSTDIMWIGDSIIAGAYSGPRTPPVVLGALSSRRVHNGGAPGATISSIAVQKGCRDTLTEGLAASSAGTIVWSCGVNDTAVTTGANMATMAQAALDVPLAQGKTVIVTGIMPFGSAGGWTAGRETERLAYNSAMSTWAAGNAAIYVDTDSMGTGSPLALTAANNSGDGLHPSPTGAYALAVLVNAVLP